MKNDEILDLNTTKEIIFDSEEYRLKIKNIESLEKQSKDLNKQTICRAIAAGLCGLSALLKLKGLTTGDMSVLHNLSFYLMCLCSGLLTITGVTNHKEKKEIDREIAEEKDLLNNYYKR